MDYDLIVIGGGAGGLDHPGAARLVFASQDAVMVDAVLVAIGRTPETRGLDPAAAGVQLDARGSIAIQQAAAQLLTEMNGRRSRPPRSHRCADEPGRPGCECEAVTMEGGVTDADFRDNSTQRGV